MDLDKYQKNAAVYRLGTAEGLHYSVLGLASEVGELAGKLKKELRDGKSYRKDIKAELGDILWYVAAVADDLDIDLSNVAMYNLCKLEDRRRRRVLQGEGDNR